jgi:hypothetical protein
VISIFGLTVPDEKARAYNPPLTVISLQPYSTSQWCLVDIDTTDLLFFFLKDIEVWRHSTAMLTEDRIYSSYQKEGHDAFRHPSQSDEQALFHLSNLYLNAS